MACGDCVQHSLGSIQFFRTAFPDGRGDQPLPISGSFELTLRCNVRCKHCYILYPGATDGEMTTDQCKQVLDKLVAAGVVFLLFTGGEPMVRPDFREIYLHAKQIGLIPSLYSNATLMNEDRVEFLQQYPPRLVEVSIYGHTEPVYESITGVPGSYKRFRRGVQLMLDAGLNVKLKTMVLKSNVHEFEQMRDWAESLGCHFRFDTIVNPKIDGDRAPLDERLTPQQIVEVEKLHPQAAEVAAEHRDLIVETMGVATDEELFHCGTGIRTFHVDPRGMLHPCMLWRKNPYDLLNQELNANWRSHLQNIRDLKNPGGACTTCSSRVGCSRCPAQALLEMSDPTKNMPFHCELSQARRNAFGEPNSHKFEIV